MDFHQITFKPLQELLQALHELPQALHGLLQAPQELLVRPLHFGLSFPGALAPGDTYRPLAPLPPRPFELLLLLLAFSALLVFSVLPVPVLAFPIGDVFFWNLHIVRE